MRFSVNKHKIEDYSRVGVLSFLREVSYIDSFGAVVIFLSDGMLKINQIFLYWNNNKGEGKRT